MLKAVIIAILSLMLPTAVLAGEFRVLSTTPLPLSRIAAGECTAVLSGRIEKGDAEKIAALEYQNLPGSEISFSYQYEEEGGEGYELDSQGLCLTDSRGGNFEEALKIVAVLREFGWATVVPRGAECLSACAIAFLGGSVISSSSNGMEHAPYRVMHVTARLAFHAPAIPDGFNPDQTVRLEVATEFFRTAIDSVTALGRALVESDIANSGPTFPRALLLELLSHFGADDLFYIDDVDKAGAYNIRLAGVPEIAIDFEAVKRLCSNAVHWSYDKHHPMAPPLSSWGYEMCPGDQEGRDGEGALCEGLPAGMSLKSALESGLEISTRHNFCSISGGSNVGDDYEVSYGRLNRGEAVRSLEPWHSLPFYVTLKDLAAAKTSFSTKPHEAIFPLNENDPTTVSKAAFLMTLPGHVLMLDHPSGENSEGGTSAINFELDGQAEIVWFNGIPERVRYSLTSDGACFDGLQGPRKVVCAKMNAADSGTWHWDFDDGRLPGTGVSFLRLGRVSSDEN